ncbi:uncharacterized protein LOC107508090 isoform X2 [Rousettus aegyptiacus]|uniref:uncharacterized protein LOC107508090 isoform X2 n=1 Tax=Rousettus aegyptiacus TaxID=9407 RepID=UPI00168D1C37|nr:uncharacterized protein LOC107508090 isoform X2 [Rousettus aegyptiacus]
MEKCGPPVRDESPLRLTSPSPSRSGLQSSFLDLAHSVLGSCPWAPGKLPRSLRAALVTRVFSSPSPALSPILFARLRRSFLGRPVREGGECGVGSGLRMCLCAAFSQTLLNLAPVFFTTEPATPLKTKEATKKKKKQFGKKRKRIPPTKTRPLRQGSKRALLDEDLQAAEKTSSEPAPDERPGG